MTSTLPTSTVKVALGTRSYDVVIGKGLLIRQTANFFDGQTPMEEAWS